MIHISHKSFSSINSRRIHKIIGLILILPMLGWTLTGLIFFIKPGYKGAYEQLTLKTYPLEKSFSIPSSKIWQEVRLVKSILGYHLLVKYDGKIEHLDPITFIEKSMPTRSQYESLLKDTLSENKERYGEIVNIKGAFAKTSNGIDIKLDWNNLKLSQKGQDTKLINLLYKVHYLQWSPFKGVNQILGIVGLLLLITLTVLGIRIYVINRD
jgi:hypothetical protein